MDNFLPFLLSLINVHVSVPLEDTTDCCVVGVRGRDKVEKDGKNQNVNSFQREKERDYGWNEERN